MTEIKIIVDDGNDKFHGTVKLYRGYSEDTSIFYLNHPERGRLRCYIEKNDLITARKRPFRKGELFILGAVLSEYGRRTAFIDRNLDKVYAPTR